MPVSEKKKKKDSARQVSEFRPLALTPVIAKCTERLVCNQLITSVADRMDPYSSRVEMEGV